ncbi:hypothetical protein [Dactylosporangium sp. NPDC051541]|uniref:hypothetical protein n=1 Tax=Dactylosporangium sp. NPDC051541 TaxID=3363977 RepID=UPI0037A1F4EF
MAKQEQRVDAEVQLEVALVLLPMIGRCVTVKGDLLVHQAGNRLDDADDRRAVVRDVARRWIALRPSERQQYSWDRATAIKKFVEAYVDEIELVMPDAGDWSTHGYDAAIEILWRKHVEEIRLRDEAI